MRAFPLRSPLYGRRVRRHTVKVFKLFVFFACLEYADACLRCLCAGKFMTRYTKTPHYPGSRAFFSHRIPLPPMHSILRIILYVYVYSFTA